MSHTATLTQAEIATSATFVTATCEICGSTRLVPAPRWKSSKIAKCCSAECRHILLARAHNPRGHYGAPVNPALPTGPVAWSPAPGQPMCSGYHLHQVIERPANGWQDCRCTDCGATRRIPFQPVGDTTDHEFEIEW
jgi:hypothetical protein